MCNCIVKIKVQVCVIFKLDDPFGPQYAFRHGLMEPGPLYAALPPHLSSHGHRRRQRAALGPPQAKTARPLQPPPPLPRQRFAPSSPP